MFVGWGGGRGASSLFENNPNGAMRNRTILLMLVTPIKAYNWSHLSDGPADGSLDW